MAHGQLRTLGSSMFLKNRFGVGYHMTVVKAPGCDANAVFGVVAQVISDAEVFFLLEVSWMNLSR